MKNYEPHELKLANELAETLKDRDALPYYLSLTRKYHEDHLRKTLAKVMSIDESQIRKTRGALFTYLVNQKYGHSYPRS
jgi:L-lysine 2,3-aminomutase